ncbi:MAG: hypothetical protein R6V19_06140 [Armatimonadota bacterium]
MKLPERSWIIYPLVFILIAAVSYGIYRYTSRPEAMRDIEVDEPPEVSQGAEPGEEADDGQGPRIVLEGGEWTQKDSQDRVLWHVKAGGEIAYDEDARQLTGDDIAFEVHRQGQPAVALEAPHFSADYEGQRLIFTEGVRGELVGRSEHFTIGTVVYEAANNKLVGSGGGEFEYGQYSARADTLVIDVKNQKTRLQGNVVLARRDK